MTQKSCPARVKQRMVSFNVVWFLTCVNLPALVTSSCTKKSTIFSF